MILLPSSATHVGERDLADIVLIEWNCLCEVLDGASVVEDSKNRADLNKCTRQCALMPVYVLVYTYARVSFALM